MNHSLKVVIPTAISKAILVWLAVEGVLFSLSLQLWNATGAPAAVFWAVLSIPATIWLIGIVHKHGYTQAVHYLRIALAAFTGGVFGAHLKQLICWGFSLFCG